MSTMRSLSETSERLCALSREHAVDPEHELAWPDAVDPDAWCTSPELVSLFGTPTWDALDEPSRKRLSFLEAVNFYSLNVHGERALIEGLARRLYRGDHTEVSPYLHHFLEEESRHMAYFGRFCTQYAGGLYPEKKLVFPREFAPGEEDALFFAKVLIFEEIVDVLNRRMAKDERLHPLARTINRLHHDDEVRHLEFGRRITAETFSRWAPTWSAETLAGVRATLAAYLDATWKEYWNPAVYRDAGLPEPFVLRRTAFDSDAARARRADVSRGAVAFLARLGALESEATP